MEYMNRHNPYFNRWFSAMAFRYRTNKPSHAVTILILIDGFLQLDLDVLKANTKYCHNPYFNRWFSAISSEFMTPIH